MTAGRWGAVAFLGGALALTIGGCSSTPGGTDGEAASPSPSRTSVTPDPPSPTPSPSAPPTAGTELPADLTLVWTRSQLPEGYVDRVEADAAVGALLVGHVAASQPLVRTTGADGAVVDATEDGWFLPVEVVVVDPADHAAVFGDRVLADLGASEAVLGETSAAVRGIGPGGALEFADGTVLEVAAVVPDELVAGAEVLVSSASPLPAGRARFLLVRPEQRGADLEPMLRSHLPADLRATVAVPGDTPILRHADAVLSPARVKQLFGEFAMRDAPGRGIEQEPGWVDRHIVTEDVPILGSVTCHREILPALRRVLSRLVEEGRSAAVDPSDYAGCWSPRTQAVGEPLSQHAWGIAVDLNAAANPFGARSRQDPRLVELMAEHGFTWGEPWLIPDPMHFEAGHGWAP